MMQTFVDEANVKSGWNFDWNWSENFQFTEYTKEQHYSWHPDQDAKPYENHPIPEFNGKIRKLSAILTLTDPNEFIGGDLQFDYGMYNIQTCYEIRPQGSVVVFPSFIRHRVTPIYKGIRNSLVMWNLGVPYK
jgi:PKHD-type hydroxylase